jgi:hypothetical protein
VNTCRIKQRRTAFHLLGLGRVKLYDLLVDGYHTPLSAVQIAELFSAGRLRRNDPCKEAGTKEFRTLDELFPLLKYEFMGSSQGSAHDKRRKSFLEGSDVVGDEVRPLTSSLKAGWICFGLGLLMSWIFPLGNVFFSIAIITAIVAMCTHQVNRGLVLLISSFFGIGVSFLIFFTLIVGVAGKGLTQAIERANTEARSRQQESRAPLTRANQQVQVIPQIAQTFSSPAQVFAMEPKASFAPPRQQVIKPVDQAVSDAEEARVKRSREIIRQTEQQRERSNERERQIELLQKSLDWYDEQIRTVRASGGNERALVEARDRLLKQKWDLQGH